VRIVVESSLGSKKEQLLKLASAISKSPEVDAEFESLEPAKNEGRICLMRITQHTPLNFPWFH
jgi:hypothetical protein